MKWHELNLEPIALDRKCAAIYVGGMAVLNELIAKELIEPRISRHRVTTFDLAALKRAWASLTLPSGLG